MTRRGAATRAAMVLGSLGVLNVVAHRTHTVDALIPAGALLVTAAARGSGLTWAELGLGGHAARRGLRDGVIAAAAAGTVIAVGALLPATAAFFNDGRYAAPLDAVVAAAVTIPLITVLPEELLFRGVLHAALARVGGARLQYAVGALAFGAWHLLGATGLAANNAGLGAVLGSGASGELLGAAGALVATSAAGAALIWLRRRSGSLIAPVSLHWALNGFAALAVIAARG